MKVYKGTDKDMKCQGKQYKIGVEAREENAKLCREGIHACEYPLDVFRYYEPGTGARYFEGELLDVSDEREGDSKVVGKRLKLNAEIGIIGLAKAAVEYIKEQVDWENATESNTGDRSAATNTGDRSAATNTGDLSAATNTGNMSAATNTGYMSAATNTGYMSAATNTGDMSAATNTGYMSAATNTGDWSAATNTGYMSAATNTGDWSAATNTGDRSAATNTGDWSAATNTGNRSAATVKSGESIAIVTGYKSKAAGAKGDWIVLTERDDEYHILGVKAFKVDGKKIKANTFYMLKDGKAVEVEGESEE